MTIPTTPVADTTAAGKGFWPLLTGKIMPVLIMLSILVGIGFSIYALMQSRQSPMPATLDNTPGAGADATDSATIPLAALEYLESPPSAGMSSDGLVAAEPITDRPPTANPATENQVPAESATLSTEASTVPEPLPPTAGKPELETVAPVEPATGNPVSADPAPTPAPEVRLEVQPLPQGSHRVGSETAHASALSAVMGRERPVTTASALPVRSTGQLNIRHGPGTEYDRIVLRDGITPCYFTEGSTTTATGQAVDAGGATWIRITLPQGGGDHTWFCPTRTFGWVSVGWVEAVDPADDLLTLVSVDPNNQ